MTEGKGHKEIETLIARHLGGTATPQEEAALEAWRLASAANRRIYEEMRRLWQEAEKIRGLARPDLDSEWEALRSRLKSRSVTTATLRTVHRKKQTTFLLRIAAVFIVGLFAAALVHMITGPLSHQVFKATAQTETVSLPDGTVIHLDGGSRLITPRRFAKDARSVDLTGTAFFEVAHDAARPFTVHAGVLEVTVLGTQFSVRTGGPAQETVVDLVKGRVEVAAPTGGKMLLAPGEEVSWNRKTKKLYKHTITDPNFLAWKTKVITFEATPLGEVLKTLEQTYHTSFRPANKETLNCRVTASFDHEPLEGVLSTLSTILDVSFEKRKEGYTVEGRGCRE